MTSLATEEIVEEVGENWYMTGIRRRLYST